MWVIIAMPCLFHPILRRVGPVVFKSAALAPLLDGEATWRFQVPCCKEYYVMMSPPVDEQFRARYPSLTGRWNIFDDDTGHLIAGGMISFEAEPNLAEIRPGRKCLYVTPDLKRLDGIRHGKVYRAAVNLDEPLNAGLWFLAWDTGVHTL